MEIISTIGQRTALRKSNNLGENQYWAFPSIGSQTFFPPSRLLVRQDLREWFSVVADRECDHLNQNFWSWAAGVRIAKALQT